MKRFLIIAFMLIAGIAHSQEMTNSMWPYMFQEFVEGTIHFKDGQVATRKVNIHFKKSELHFIDKNVIQYTDGNEILSVIINNQNFIFIEGSLIKVEEAQEDGFVGTIVVGDFDRLNEATGAYGTTSNVSATQEYSSVEIGGLAANTNHMELSRNRDSGVGIYLLTTRYIVTGNKKYKASKSSINRELSKDAKKSFKTFLKEEDIDWDNPKSIIKVVDFLKTNVEN